MAFREPGRVDQGRYERPSPRTIDSAVKYKFSDAINLPGPGAMSLKSPFDGMATSRTFFRDAMDPDPTVNFMCSGGYSKRSSPISLPKDVKVLAMPQGRRDQGQIPDLQSDLSAERRHGNCGAGNRGSHAGAGMRARGGRRLQEIRDDVRKELRTQLLYQ